MKTSWNACYAVFAAIKMRLPWERERTIELDHDALARMRMTAIEDNRLPPNDPAHLPGRLLSWALTASAPA